MCRFLCEVLCSAHCVSRCICVVRVHGVAWSATASDLYYVVDCFATAQQKQQTGNQTKRHHAKQHETNRNETTRSKHTNKQTITHAHTNTNTPMRCVCQFVCLVVFTIHTGAHRHSYTNTRTQARASTNPRHEIDLCCLGTPIAAFPISFSLLSFY